MYITGSLRRSLHRRHWSCGPDRSVYFSCRAVYSSTFCLRLPTVHQAALLCSCLRAVRQVALFCRSLRAVRQATLTWRLHAARQTALVCRRSRADGWAVRLFPRLHTVYTTGFLCGSLHGAHRPAFVCLCLYSAGRAPLRSGATHVCVCVLICCSLFHFPHLAVREGRCCRHTACLPYYRPASASKAHPARRSPRHRRRVRHDDLADPLCPSKRHHRWFVAHAGGRPSFDSRSTPHYRSEACPLDATAGGANLTRSLRLTYCPRDCVVCSRQKSSSRVRVPLGRRLCVLLRFLRRSNARIHRNIAHTCRNIARICRSIVRTRHS